MSKRVKPDVTVSANGSIELEKIVIDTIHAKISNEVEALAEKYYRDITVDVAVNIK